MPWTASAAASNCSSATPSGTATLSEGVGWHGIFLRALKFQSILDLIRAICMHERANELIGDIHGGSS